MKRLLFCLLLWSGISFLLCGCSKGGSGSGTPPPPKPVPVIDSIKPNNNPVDWPVLIMGTNVEGITKISFGGVDAPIDTNFTGTVTTRVPASVGAGVVQLTITNANGTSKSVPFTVLAVAPAAQPPFNKILYRSRARYIPLVDNFWQNEADGSYDLKMQGNNDPDQNYEVFNNDFNNAFPLKISYINTANYQINVTINRGDSTETYTGGWVESDDPNFQRIIFWTKAGRQCVVRVQTVF